MVGDTRQSLDAAPSDALYVPLDQAAPLTALDLMRTIGPVSAELPRQAREALYSIDPNQPADQFRTLDEVRSQSTETPRLTAMLIGLLAGVAVLITAAGPGGVMAFSVNQRTQEFGVRMALGATPSSLLRMVLTQGLALVVAGLALGVIGALVFGQTLRALLFNVQPTDLLTYGLVSIAFVAVAVIACALPARRAASVDPMTAQRGVGFRGDEVARL